MSNKFQQLAENITNEILEELKKGNVIWKQPFSNLGFAKNYYSNRVYDGFNQFYLSYVSNKRNYENPFFVTFKQAKENGFYIKKGAKSVPVVYWKVGEKEISVNGIMQTEKYCFPFVHYVFNVADVEGLTIHSNNEARQIFGFGKIERCENIIDGMPLKPVINFGGHSAYYELNEDFVQMPKVEYFLSEDAYYSTLFHELIHSTGHEMRLNRFKDKKANAQFGSPVYSKEELTAEIGAAFLCGVAGITNTDNLSNSVAYIQSWLAALKNDKTLIVFAAQKAMKAASFIINDKQSAIAENSILEIESLDAY